MSTKKYLAKWNPNGIGLITETETVVKYLFNLSEINIEGCQFVIIKHINTHHSSEYRYEVYKIPWNEAFDPRFDKKYLRWFGKGRYLGYIIKGEL